MFKSELDYQNNVNQTLELFNREVNKLFPETILINNEIVPQRHIYTFQPKAGLSKDTININWYSCNKTQPSLDHLNSINIRFMMHLTTHYHQLPQNNDKFSIELLSIDYRLNKQLKESGKQYRKITSKTPLEAMTKLIKWFSVNQEIFNNQPLYKPF